MGNAGSARKIRGSRIHCAGRADRGPDHRTRQALMSSTDETAVPVLAAEELRQFTDFLYRQTGMLFGENKRYYIDRRVSERRVATGLACFPDYFAMLRAERGELELLINTFTVNET